MSNSSEAQPKTEIDWRSHLRRLEGAYAETTLRGYGTDFAIFASHCLVAGACPLPASPEAVAAFVAEQSTRYRSTTIKRRLAAVAKLHRLARVPSPCDDEEVRIALRRAFRSKSRRQRQAVGLNLTMLEKMLDGCDTSKLFGLRNRLILLVAYDTLCRRSELVALRVEDLTETTDGGLLALVRRSKTDQYGDGRLAYLTPRTASAIAAWREAAKISSGLLVRGMRNGRVREEGLASGCLSPILKGLARAAGLTEETIAGLSGHSARVGHAQDLCLAGADVLSIMRAGGWKTTSTVARYVENAELQRLGVKASAWATT